MFTNTEAKELLEQLELLSREPTLTPKARLVVKAIVADLEGDDAIKSDCMNNLEWLNTHSNKPKTKPKSS